MQKTGTLDGQLLSCCDFLIHISYVRSVSTFKLAMALIRLDNGGIILLVTEAEDLRLMGRRVIAPTGILCNGVYVTYGSA
jgi:hypothetical protein